MQPVMNTIADVKLNLMIVQW